VRSQPSVRRARVLLVSPARTRLASSPYVVPVVQAVLDCPVVVVMGEQLGGGGLAGGEAGDAGHALAGHFRGGLACAGEQVLLGAWPLAGADCADAGVAHGLGAWVAVALDQE
jgi:hypothetical protein